MPSSILLKAIGLNTSPNTLAKSDGSLDEASNVIIRRDNVVESRRGFKLYGQAFGIAKQLRTYQNRIIRHYSNILSFDSGTQDADGQEIFTDFFGNYLEPQTGIKIKSVEAAKNFYFTTSDGIKKISALNAAGLSGLEGFITQAGGVKAIDLSGRVNVSPGNELGWFFQDSAVAYRTVWGTVDVNENLILGAPSQREVVYNPLISLMLPDFVRVLNALDNIGDGVPTDSNSAGTLIDNNNYVTTLQLNENSSASELQTNLIALATKLDNDIVYASESGNVLTIAPNSASTIPAAGGNTAVIAFSAGDATDYWVPGSHIYISGYTPTVTPDGATFNTGQTVVDVFPPVATTGDTATGDNRLTNVASTTGIIVGMNISDGTVNIPVGTVVIAIIGSTVYMSQNATGVSVADSVTFGSAVTFLTNTSGMTKQITTTADVTQGSTSLTTVADTTNIFRGYTIAGIGIPENTVVLNIAGATITMSNSATTTNTGSNYIFTSPIQNVTQSSPMIVSNEYRFITQPPVPAIPATNNDLVALQAYLQAILDRLQSEPNNTLFTTLSDEFIDPILLTTSATVILTISIPQDITSKYFLQIYRSAQVQATGVTSLTNLIPSDELQQVYEAYPTAQELEQGFMIVEDIVSDAFRGANLYTNPQTGQGILQANDIPPFALDIARFKNVIFYANTRTRFRLNASLLGITNMIADYNSGTTPNIVITDGTLNSTYTFVTGLNQSVDVTTNAGGTLAAAGPGSYFNINSANNDNLYYVWYQIGTSTDPMVSGRTGIEVVAQAGDTANEIAQKTANAVNSVLLDFNATVVTNVVTITNTNYGYTDPATAETSGFSISTTAGRGELVAKQTTDFTLVAAAALNAVGSGNYFTLNTKFDRGRYYVWYQLGTSTDPIVANRTGIQVTVLIGDTAAQVAAKTVIALNALTETFIASSVGSTLTVSNFCPGPAQDPTNGTMPGGFSHTVTQEGFLQVVLSNSVSPAIAIDETARSLIRVINRDECGAIYAYYLSGAGEVPGRILFESRTLTDDPFYVLANNSNTGASFNPNLSPLTFITSISAASPTVITTSTPHGLINGDSVVISDTDSIPNVDGLYAITFISTTQFSIPVQVITAGTQGAMINADVAVVGENEVRPHRIYFSKFLQPEAVPIVNWMDVGSENKAILRIFPLRDSLFVFKEDGVFRISGETAPYNVALFDTSYILISADSLDISNNIIYGWTRQGIQTVSESGTSIISRPIDVDILPLASSNYPNFATATWGVGYESDNSYLVFTVSHVSDTVATICYRYSTLTNSWTTWAKSNTCGVVNPADDKMYFGAGDVNFLEQERKTFTRIDYADREIATELIPNFYFENGIQIKLSSVANVNIGDVLTQNQLLTVYEYNALLQKLDDDVGLANHDYFSVLEAFGGNNLRSKIVDLANKLDADANLVNSYFSAIDTKTGAVTSTTFANPIQITSVAHGLVNNRIITITGSNSIPSIDGTWEVTVLNANTFSIPTAVTTSASTGTWATEDEDFRDIRACYNEIVRLLNTDTGTVFKNYMLNAIDTLMEAIIIDVNVNTTTITLNNGLDFVQGPLIIFNAIPNDFTYSANTMDSLSGFKIGHPASIGDPLGLKHLREATVMFDNMAFTSATLSFSSDLKPSFFDIDFEGEGNGIFGAEDQGNQTFGGQGTLIPFRTYVPRDYQRCRYLVVKFTHRIAREKWAILGYTVTGEVSQSSRAYR